MKRFFDLIIGITLLFIFSLPLLIIALIIRVTSRGPALFWSNRVGKFNVIFKMPKLRTMSMDAPAVASHLMSDPNQFTSSFGRFLRRTSIDELPQLFSILKGDMSFVGPRPALFNQYDLIALREERGIDQILPGLTGWAQVNGRDELPIIEKVAFDKEYLDRQSFSFDMKILWMTVFNVARKDGVSH